MNLDKIKAMVRRWLTSDACIDRLMQIYAWEIETLRTAARGGDSQAKEILGRLALQGQQ